jgi:hypothetical protein
MSAFIPVAPNHASRLVNHGPTVLVTSAHGGRRNVMAAAWSMPVEFTPPRIAVVIDKKTFTRELVAPRIFANGRWDFRADNAELQTIHHLGGGNFVRANGMAQARPL